MDNSKKKINNKKGQKKSSSTSFTVIIGIIAILIIAVILMNRETVVSQIEGVSNNTYKQGMKAIDFIQAGIGLPDYVPESENIANQMYMDMLEFYGVYDNVNLQAEEKGNVSEVELCFLDAIFIALGARSSQVDFISIQTEAKVDAEFWASYDFDQSVLVDIENTYASICQEAIDTVLSKDPEKICHFVNSEEWMDKLYVYDAEFAQLDIILQAAIDSKSEAAPTE